MNKKIIILALGLTSSIQIFGQTERQAIENIWKGKWEKAYYQLDRAVNKDTLQIATAYAWSIYFGAVNNPDFSLDSASRYVRSSLALYGRATVKQRERLRRFPLDSATLVSQRNGIDSAAFEAARATGSVEAYQHFIDFFPDAVLLPTAIDARDERAFQDAVAINTYVAFGEYLTRYPGSSRLADARANYERLLYKAYTQTGNLAGYERFLAEHPGTSFEKEAARNVFEIRTAQGTAESFTRFLQLQHPFHRRAADILFHLRTDNEENLSPDKAWSDSIRHLLKVTPRYVVPFLKGGKFGFMNPHGDPVLDANSNAILDDYLCGNIADNIIQLDSSLVALNGAVIFRGNIEEVEDIGLGMLLVQSRGCRQIIHKSGWIVNSSCVERAKIVGRNFLAVQTDGKWRLTTLTGRTLIDRDWDDINTVNQWVVLESDRQKYVAPPVSLARIAVSPQGDKPYARVDKVNPWPGGLSWMRQGNKEWLLDGKSDTVAVTEEGTIMPTRFGVVIQNDSSSRTVNWKREISEPFRAIQVSNTGALVKTSAGWRMYDPSQRLFTSPEFDSLWCTGSFALGTRKDSAFVYFPDGGRLKLKGRINVALVQGPDSTSFLLIDGGNAKPSRLFTRNGKLMFPVPYEKIQSIGKGYFRVTKGGKVGIVAADGKLVVPVTMDATGVQNGQSISLLKDGRFGLFNCSTRKVMLPQFPTNPTPYGKRYVIAQKNGLNGIITWDNKPVSKYEFEEVRYWNDTVAFVRRDSKWSMLNLVRDVVVVDQIRDLRFIRERTDDQLAIIHSGDLFGVWHNRKGSVIPLNFTDIVNVGSAEYPMFFTEKNIEEASMYVVIYYDHEGKLLRKEVYNADDYERIYCPNN